MVNLNRPDKYSSNHDEIKSSRPYKSHRCSAIARIDRQRIKQVRSDNKKKIIEDYILILDKYSEV